MHTIVVGNEKGGSGKSTTTMHIIAALLHMGYEVGSMDLDSRQRTLTRYLENRMNFLDKKGIDLPFPKHVVVDQSEEDSKQASQAEEAENVNMAVDALSEHCDFLVVDLAGNANFLTQYGLTLADTLVTPINDSFIDMDLLATIDPDTMEVIKASNFAELVWNQRKMRLALQKGSTDWIVMRNRLSQLNAKNKRQVSTIMAKLSSRVGFRVAPGFGERVIYRELFLKGLTLLDLTDKALDVRLTMSHVAARQEVRDLISTLKLPGVEERLGTI